jgi:beta-lactam-binding protein with PASTA domain
MLQDAATAAIGADGFTLGTVTSEPVGTSPIPPAWVVLSQDPAPGVKKPAGSPINLVMADKAATSCP